MSNPPVGPPPHSTGTNPIESQLEQCFELHRPELFGMLYHMLGSAEDARDAYQEAFVKCWRARDMLGNVADRKAWVFRVAINTAKDLRANYWRRHRRTLDDNHPMTDPQPAIDAALDQNHELARVRKAITDLRAEEQEVFLLRQNGDMTYDEIARVLEIPLATAKTRMRTALHKLREALSPPTS